VNRDRVPVRPAPVAIPPSGRMIDTHSHILPALDDGPQDVAQSLEMAGMAVRDGIETVVGTPHMFCGQWSPTAAEIRRACDDLSSRLHSASTPLCLRYASEVGIVDDMPGRVRRGELPTFDEAGRYLLIEPPLAGDCGSVLREVVFRLRLADIVPVVAHPERVEAFLRDPDLADRLVEQGAVLQANAASVADALSRRGFGVVLDMFRRGLIHLIASDAHDAIRRPPLLSATRRICESVLGEDAADTLFVRNPQRILAGQDVVRLNPADLRPSGRHRNAFAARWLQMLAARLTARGSSRPRRAFSSPRS
jgi:protein-tyrosine phosphatase